MTRAPILTEGSSVRLIKTTVKTLMPDATYGRTAAGWRFCKHWRRRLSWTAQTWFKIGVPETLVHFGIGPGDDLLCTVVLRELRKRGNKKIWMMSKHPELFEQNRDVDRIVPIDDRFREYVGTFRKKWQQLEYARADFKKD